MRARRSNQSANFGFGPALADAIAGLFVELVEVDLFAFGGS
jgi:hypothetical protein